MVPVQEPHQHRQPGQRRHLDDGKAMGATTVGGTPPLHPSIFPAICCRRGGRSMPLRWKMPAKNRHPAADQPVPILDAVVTAIIFGALTIVSGGGALFGGPDMGQWCPSCYASTSSPDLPMCWSASVCGAGWNGRGHSPSASQRQALICPKVAGRPSCSPSSLAT